MRRLCVVRPCASLCAGCVSASCQAGTDRGGAVVPCAGVCGGSRLSRFGSFSRFGSLYGCAAGRVRDPWLEAVQ